MISFCLMHVFDVGELVIPSVTATMIIDSNVNSRFVVMFKCFSFKQITLTPLSILKSVPNLYVTRYGDNKKITLWI